MMMKFTVVGAGLFPVNYCDLFFCLSFKSQQAILESSMKDFSYCSDSEYKCELH